VTTLLLLAVLVVQTPTATPSITPTSTSTPFPTPALECRTEPGPPRIRCCGMKRYAWVWGPPDFSLWEPAACVLVP